MIAWHYTIRQHLPSILEDAFLRPTTVGVAPPEKPILWFSRNQIWEPTANKMFRASDGSLRFGTRETTREMGGGLVRFGLPTEKLLRWTELHREAHMPTRTRNALVKAAKRDGSNPYDWCGLLEPVSIYECAVEIESELIWIPTTATALREDLPV
jgi:hypothetical protein